ncbi:MAG: elongation factor P, partial [Clostridia bacterium]|nr:elongation factor P [Clostridia bacterium]
FQHVKPGKGSPFVRIKMKSLTTGATTESSFRPEDKFENAMIEKKDMQYMYNDGELYYFMDNETYEQLEVNAQEVGDSLKFVKENETVKIRMFEGKVFGIEPPLFVELEITDTEPGFKGNTATGATKPAFVETGAKVMVPLFIEQGEKIQIDTRTGEYLKRV